MVSVYLGKLSGEKKSESRETRKLLEKALLMEFPQIKMPIEIEKGSHGKPFLKSYPHIHINVSHTKGFGICALSTKKVGIDVEMWTTRKYCGKVVDKFHIRERELYETTEEAEKRELFFRLWVLKESFLKATGVGLSRPLNSFCVLDGEEEGYFSKEYKVLEFPELKIAVYSEDYEFKNQVEFLEIE